PSDALTPDMRREIRKVLRRFGAADVRVFGSVARGTDGPGSDLDIMATFPKTFSLLGLMEVEEQLEALLGVRVDVVFDNPRRSAAMRTAKREAVVL
ncbi:MAG: nucleotidyltransferase family protein, partial [Nocardioidaceae bacterium]